MLKAIDIGELINPEKIKSSKVGIAHRNHNPVKKTIKMFSQDGTEVQNVSKIIVPIK